MNGIRAASYVQIKTRTLRRAVMVCKAVPYDMTGTCIRSRKQQARPYVG